MKRSELDRLAKATKHGKNGTERSVNLIANSLLDLDDRLVWVERKLKKKKQPVRTTPLGPDELKIIGYLPNGKVVLGPKDSK